MVLVLQKLAPGNKDRQAVFSDCTEERRYR